MPSLRCIIATRQLYSDILTEISLEEKAAEVFIEADAIYMCGVFFSYGRQLQTAYRLKLDILYIQNLRTRITAEQTM